MNKAHPTGYTFKITDYHNGKKEITLYDKPQAIGFKRKHTPERSGSMASNEDNLKRARKNVYQLVDSNLTPYTKFITLTYADNMEDYDKLAKDFKVFIRHLKRKGIEFPYLWVVEKQKRGALHVHCLAFTDEYIPHDRIAKAWPHGFVKINAEWKKVDHKAAYVAKYIQKDTVPPEKKAYRTSKNIKRPTSKVGQGSFQDALPQAQLKGYKRTDKVKYSIPSYQDTVNVYTGELEQKKLFATVHKFEKTKYKAITEWEKELSPHLVRKK